MKLKDSFFLSLIIGLSCISIQSQFDIRLHKFKNKKITNDSYLSQKEKYHIALIDSSIGYIERIFVVINSEELDIFQESVCGIEKFYKIDEKTSISYFSDFQYANYKDQLFEGENKTLEMSEYESWINIHYIADFQYGENILTMYPYSYTKTKKAYKLESCK